MKKVLIVLLGASLLGACTSQPSKVAPVGSLSSDSAKRTHIVVKGDTLYSIAFRYGWDHQDLAQLNRISPPYDIHIGETIHLVSNKHKYEHKHPNKFVQKKSETRSHITKKYDAPIKNAELSIQPSVFDNANNHWQWPVKGKLLKRFQEGQTLAKGIDIAGVKGNPVYAAADGEVVYAGSGLRGFGELIILKHDNDYLSAYAHNDKIIVSEGNKVKAGQRIADMGDSGAERVKLHFEIRRRGKPVDPLRYLPATS